VQQNQDKRSNVLPRDFTAFTQGKITFSKLLKKENWRTQEDSNLWPLPSEGSALSS
jgi:hypothetical protein